MPLVLKYLWIWVYVCLNNINFSRACVRAFRVRACAWLENILPAPNLERNDNKAGDRRSGAVP